MKFAVVGSGQMGIGIAKVLETISEVTIIGINSSINMAKDADFVFEAVPENEAIKRKVIQDISAITNGVIATNTSSIPITRLASYAGSKAPNVIGMHFMNPVPKMKLVEVIPGLQTSQETIKKTILLAENMKKITTFSKDVPGFIANRLLMPYINEAIFALHEGIATAKDIDDTMIHGARMPMGPLALADFIGLDTCLSILEVLHKELGDKYRPCSLLRTHVDCGHLGKKSKKGFYKYE